MREQNWREIVKKAKLYIELGQDDHYLYPSKDGDQDYPWEFVTFSEPGGGHRLDIATSVRFSAEHPSGLKFSWIFDIEPRDASGGYYMIDVEGCQKVLNSIKGKHRTDFATYLKECAHKVATKADDWKKITDNQYKVAEDLMKASKI